MLDKIRKLREKTGAGVMEAKRALELAGGDLIKAEEEIRARGIAKAEAKSERATGAGRVYSYIHNTGRVGAMVELACETDFVAANDEFVTLCKEVALQVASMNPADVEELSGQAYIRDGSRTMGELVKELVAKTGENIKIVRFARFELGAA